jgi:hypothetical protein
MRVLGVANHTPEQVLVWLLKKKIILDIAEVAVIPEDTILRKKTPARTVLFALSTQSVLRNLLLLNSRPYGDVKVFVFGSALDLSSIKGAVKLDYACSDLNPVIFTYGDMLLSALKPTAACVATVRRVEFLQKLTDLVKVGSILNPLMTFIYTLPSATHQTPVKELIAKCMYKGFSVSKLFAQFDELPITVSDRIRIRIKEILESEAGVNYKAALKTSRTDGIDAAVRKHSVSLYELNYLIAIAAKR